jgi:hypothetical protein
MPVSTRGTIRNPSTPNNKTAVTHRNSPTPFSTPRNSRDSSSRRNGDDNTETAALSETELTSPRRNRIQNLSTAVEKQLLQDTLRAGGFEFVGCKEICDEKPEIYGKPGSALRRQIQNKFDKWKRTAPELDPPAVADLINLINRKQILARTPKKKAIAKEPTIAASSLAHQLPSPSSPQLRFLPQESRSPVVSPPQLRPFPQETRNIETRTIRHPNMGDSTDELFQKLFGGDQEDYESRVSK